MSSYKVNVINDITNESETAEFDTLQKALLSLRFSNIRSRDIENYTLVVNDIEIPTEVTNLLIESVKLPLK